MAKAAKMTTIDLWAQINGGRQLNAAEQAVIDSGIVQAGKPYSPPEVLVLGQTHRDDVFKFCGIKAKKVIWHQRDAGLFPDAENWPYAQAGELFLFFDADMRWQGLNWGPGTNTNSQVSGAVLHEHDATEDDDVVAGRLRLLLNGGRIQQYAALPDFIGCLSRRGIRFALDATGYDKWVQLHARGGSGLISANFSLQALKARYESRFEIDYCLTSLTLLAPGIGQWSAGWEPYED